MNYTTMFTVENELARVRELLAEAYKIASGYVDHASDCATSSAPAETPRPCDCHNYDTPRALRSELAETLKELIERNGDDMADTRAKRLAALRS